MKRTVVSLIGVSIFLSAGAAAQASLDTTAGASSDASPSTRSTQSRMDVSDPNTTGATSADDVSSDASASSPGSNRSTTGMSASETPMRQTAAARSLSDATHDYAMKSQARLDEIDAWIRLSKEANPNKVKRMEASVKSLRSELDRLRIAKDSDWRRSQTRFETAMQDLERDFTKAQTSVN